MHALVVYESMFGNTHAVAGGPGLRDWFHGFEQRHVAAAAFDTRFEGGAASTGRASLGIAQRLRRHGFVVIVAPESFLVDERNHLLAGGAERARQWGATLAGAAVERMTPPALTPHW
jgi:hypothetical protein